MIDQPRPPVASPVAGGDRLPGWLMSGIALPGLPSAGTIAAGGLALLGTIAVLIPVFPMGEKIKFGPLPAMAVFALLTAGLTGLTLLRGGLRALPRGPAMPLALAFIALHVLISLLSTSPGLDLLALTWTIWLSSLLLAAATPPHLGQRVVIAWIALAVPIASYAIYEQVTGPRPLFRRDLVEDYRRLRVNLGGRRLIRAQATFGHPAPLASYLVAVAALALWAIPLPRAWLRRAARAAILAILVAGVAATLTRGAFVALAVAVGVGLLAPRVPGRVKAAILIAGAIVALALAPTSLGESVRDYADDTDRLARAPGRMATVRSLDDVLSAPPSRVVFGWGGGTRDELYDRGVLEAADDFEVVDNQYIALLTEVGLVGLTLFAVLVVVALRRAWITPGWWPFGLGAALLGVLTALVFYDGLTWPSTSLLLWTLIGFIARADSPPAPELGDPILRGNDRDDAGPGGTRAVVPASPGVQPPGLRPRSPLKGLNSNNRDRGDRSLIPRARIVTSIGVRPFQRASSGQPGGLDPRRCLSGRPHSTPAPATVSACPAIARCSLRTVGGQLGPPSPQPLEHLS
jgi:O-antigen ligase